MHGYLKPATMVSNIETALQTAEHAINDWLAVANDPKGADGKPIQYSHSNLKILEQARSEKREHALSKAREAGFDTFPFEQRFDKGEFPKEINAALAFRDEFNAAQAKGRTR